MPGRLGTCWASASSTGAELELRAFIAGRVWVSNKGARTAQPIETGRPSVPQTVAQIRAALPDDGSRVRFDADLSGATRFEVAGVVDEWWPRALLAGMPDVRADIETTMAALRRGEDVDLVPATEVAPDWPHR
jgi:hypothetical protein